MLTADARDRLEQARQDITAAGAEIVTARAAGTVDADTLRRYRSALSRAAFWADVVDRLEGQR